jgi:hypothetical protein
MFFSIKIYLYLQMLSFNIIRAKGIIALVFEVEVEGYG